MHGIYDSRKYLPYTNWLDQGAHSEHFGRNETRNIDLPYAKSIILSRVSARLENKNMVIK